MSNKPTYPSAGGTHARNADGSLTQTEPSTRPHPGKTQLAAEAEAEAAAAQPRTRRADKTDAKQESTP